MNPHSSHLAAADDEQASLWAARIDGGELTEADNRELETWFADNPARRALVAQYCQFSAELEHRLPLLVESGAIELPRPTNRVRNPWWPVLAGAGLVAAAAAVALVLWSGRAGSSVLQQAATPPAHRQTLTLDDGTRVEMYAQTRLSVDIDRRERRVQLTGGEAFFAVSKDSARPFVVQTPAGRVQVTGTQFDVRAEPGSGLEVVVAEGSVLVSPAEVGGQEVTPVVLVAGSRLSTATGKVAVDTLSENAVADALAWRHGQVVFNGTPLSEALARFARYHGRDITATPAAAGLRIGARCSLDDLEGFLASLEDIQNQQLRVKHEPNGKVQVSLRTES